MAKAAALPSMQEAYGGVAMISIMWIIMQYVIMPLGPTAGMKKCSNGQQKWGHRAFLNMGEQGILFNGSLWLYAVFVCAEGAVDLGTAYLALRACFPVVWLTMGGESGQPDIASMLTFPQYAINLYSKGSSCRLGNGCLR